MNNTDKKIVSEELYRIKELMGVKVVTESINGKLLMESGKAIDDLIGLGPKSVDNLKSVGLDFTNDLSKLSDEFASRGIKTFDDLSNVVAKSRGLDIGDLTSDMIEAYIKNDEVLYSSILKRATEAASKITDELIKSADLSKVFSKSPLQLNSYKTYISTAPTQRNIDVLSDGVNQSTIELDKIINDIKTGKVPGVNTVPRDLNELYEMFLSKKLELNNFKNRGDASNAVSGQKKPNDLKTKIEELIYNSIDDNESKILILRQMADEMEKAAKLRGDVTKRFREGNK